MSARATGRAPFSRREWGLTGLLLCGGALAWWWHQGQSPPLVPAAVPERHPDFVVDGLRALNLDPSGHPLRRLRAVHLRHYADDGSSELDQPVLLSFSADDTDGTANPGDPPPPWTARGNTGWVTEAGDELLLQGDVVVERAATASAPPIRLTSAELLVLPGFDYAETAHFARLDAGEDWVTAASGLRVWFDEPMRAKLFGRVHASHTPRPDATAEPLPGSRP